MVYYGLNRNGEAMTRALIPTDGVFVTETRYPHGWQVARYDHEGFTSDVRWFRYECLGEAKGYRDRLETNHV